MSIQTVHIHKVAHSLNVKLLSHHFKDSIIRFEEGIIVGKKKKIAVFHNGIIVDWGDEEQVEVLRSIPEIWNKQVEDESSETFTYSRGKAFKIDQDTIIMPLMQPHWIYVVSFALAQSVQLSYREERIEQMLKKTDMLPKQLEQYGRVKLSGKKLKKIVGSIMQFEYNMRLSLISTEKPEIVWEKSQLDPVYINLARHLELRDRSLLLQEKVEVLHRITDVVRDEMNTHHTAILEWIVIALIAVEVVFFLIEIF